MISKAVNCCITVGSFHQSHWCINTTSSGQPKCKRWHLSFSLCSSLNSSVIYLLSVSRNPALVSISFPTIFTVLPLSVKNSPDRASMVAKRVSKSFAHLLVGNYVVNADKPGFGPPSTRHRGSVRRHL